jgi:hypothetical protein
MSLLLSCALVGIALRDTDVLFHGVLFVDLSGKSGLPVQ